MKTKINYLKCHSTVLMAFCIAFFLLSIKVKGQTAVTMTLQNTVQTSANTFEYDIMITNTGTTSIALRGYSFGVNHTTGLENGGTITYTYISGSRDALLSSLPVPTTLYTAPNHLRLVTTAAATGNEVLLTLGVNYKLARVQVQTSAASFPCNFNPFLPSAASALQLLTATGKTECAATCYVNYPSTSNYLLYGSGNTATGTSLNVLTGIIIPSPSGGTPFILNSTSPTTSNVTTNNSYNWACNGLSYTVSGTYTCTTFDANGCVVTNTLNLTINNNTTSSITVYSCTPYFWPESTITYTVSGTYTHVALNPNGSSNTATLILIITTPATVNTNFTLAKSVYCIGDVISAASLMPSPNNGTTLVNQWNTYNANANCVPDYPNPPIVQDYGNSFSKVLSNGQFIPGHHYVLQHGMYSNCMQYTSTIICFSISPTTETNNVTSSCYYSWPCNGLTYTASGQYTCSTINANGCPVTTTLNVTITPSPTITIGGNLFVCAGNTTVLTPSGSSTYSISSGGSTSPPFTVGAGTYTITGTDANGCSNTTSVTVSVAPCNVKVSPKVLLSGPYNVAIGLMNDDLRSATPSLIPLIEPYTALPYSKQAVNEPAGETTTPAIRSITGPNAIVDWVLIELRNVSPPYQVVSTRRALVQRNGNVVDVNGSAPVSFPNTPQGTYQVSIKHRNHLGVMTTNPVAFGANPVAVDFTNPNIPVWVKPLPPPPPNSPQYNDPRRLQGSIYTLWAGNANLDMIVKYNGPNNDKLVISMTDLFPVYSPRDLNMDRHEKYNTSNNDKDVITNNIIACPQNTSHSSGYILYQHTPD